MRRTKKHSYKLSLSSETLRSLTAPDLAGVQGGLYVTVSYCVGTNDDHVCYSAYGDSCQISDACNIQSHVC